MASKLVAFIVLFSTEILIIETTEEKECFLDMKTSRNVCNFSDSTFLQFLLSEEKLLRMELERKVKIQNEELYRLSAAQQLLHNYSATAASERKPTVAFSAQLSNDIVDVSLGHRVIFDKVVLNQEGAYDVTKGIFRAPVSGIYQFFLQTCSPPQKSGHLYVIQDGQTIGFAPTTSSDWSCIGISSVVQLQEGNKVWVEMLGYASGILFGTDKYVHIRTALSGFYVGRA